MEKGHSVKNACKHPYPWEGVEATPGLQLYIQLDPFKTTELRHSKEWEPRSLLAKDSMCMVLYAYQPYFVLLGFPQTRISCPGHLRSLSVASSPLEDLPRLLHVSRVAFSFSDQD